MRWLLSVLCLVAGPAAADGYCDDLWFARNLVYANAGYCFGSPLGKAMFGNEGCTGKDVALSAQDQALVAEIQKLETMAECQVDTARTGMEIRDLAWRMRMLDLPVPSYGASACFGWRGEARALFAARDETAAITGELLPGDTLMFAFEAEADQWDYVEVMRDEALVAAGWMRVQLGEDVCTELAG